jgi:hypothetical protein
MYFVKFPDALREKWRIFFNHGLRGYHGSGPLRFPSVKTTPIGAPPFDFAQGKLGLGRALPFVNRPLIRVIPCNP